MDRTRLGLTAVIAGAAITAAASAFAVGAAITADDGAPHGDHAAPESTAAGDTATDATSGETLPVQTATGRFEIEIIDFQFTPRDAVVQPGTEVVWTNSDPEHSVVSTGDLGFDDSPSTLSRGDSYSFVFTEPGTYTYICGIHPATMAGTITVEG
jgi:plastocyanin